MREALMVQSVPADFQTDPGTNFMEANAEPRPNLRTELVAGVTTFFTMAYIVVVNPLILSGRGSEPPVETGMPFSGVLTATVLVCFSMTLLMGVYARLPFAVAPGMGLNAFFVYAVILGRGVPWPVALGAVFWAGVLFLVGTFMFSGVAGLDFRHMEDALPAFLTIILIPLTFSITQGILWGFITHAGLYTLAGRAREVGAVMYALALISVGLLLLERFA
jgi:xanthine/uracil/vitamin C permease (AzgA family)